MSDVTLSDGRATDASLPPGSPDAVAQTRAEASDSSAPEGGDGMIPLVGLGGSAGSIPVMLKFFEAMPSDSGMAFAVVIHLLPDHRSTLPELIGRVTKMRVQAVDQDGCRVQPNEVYVIPPGSHLLVDGARLRLVHLENELGHRTAVDVFFRSMADSYGHHAIAVVLSGADGDGALGVKRVKERGGLTIAQDPQEAEHEGMPQAAIATRMVDWVMPVQEMPARLVEYQARERRLRVPPEEGPQPAQAPQAPPAESELALREVLALLRARTGHEFSYYKRATIVRRISRRMQISGLEDLPGYLTYLRTHPGEAAALLQDLLISVTNFFRDREVFEYLATMIPELLRGKGSSDAVRVWVPACASGEEAYSIAMLLLDHIRTMESPPMIQIFGCDLDEAAIKIARAGVYPEAIVADVSEERLRRFFIKEHHGYRVRRELREVVLFSVHDLLKDAPFSRMDLISCRNLLIYLNPDAQTRALDIFHFALRPQGLLLLGSSESVDEETALFEVVDKKHRLYRQRPAQRIGIPVPVGPSTLMRALEAQQDAQRGPVLPGPAFSQLPALSHDSPPGMHRVSAAELHFRMLERLAPPSVLINADHDILHISESAGRYLQISGGEPTRNLLKVVHPMLRLELRAALFKAGEAEAPVEIPRVPLEIDGVRRAVTIRVTPARELSPGLLLVNFEAGESASPVGPAPEGRPMEQETVVRQLEREVEMMKGRLRDTVEQYEANTEELKASNEELQAMNEELRSTTEELETSREELQSINEELSTVNQELKSKLEELGHANSDLHNLMSSTAIATVFLDRDLRITRYTPTAISLFRIIPTDVGRPLADLRSRLEYPDLTADALRVLEKLVPVEREVQGDGHWFLARLLPYRTLDDHIGGVVLTFVDITANKGAEAEMRARNQELERFNSVVVDRELRMVQLKREINELLQELGRPARYTPADTENTDARP